MQKFSKSLFLAWIIICFAGFSVASIAIIEGSGAVAATSLVAGSASLFLMFAFILPITWIPKLMPRKLERISKTREGITVENSGFFWILFIAVLLLSISAMPVAADSELQLRRGELYHIFISASGLFLFLYSTIFILRNRELKARVELSSNSILFDYGNRDIFHCQVDFEDLQFEDGSGKCLAIFDECRNIERKLGLITGKPKVKEERNGKIKIPFMTKRHGEWKLPFSADTVEEIRAFYGK